MRDRKILCLLSSILLVLGINSLHAETPARVDRHGDPLPEGAIARLGTVGWQLPAHGTAVAFSSDGKKIGVGDSSGHVLLFDSATGKEERRWQAHTGSVRRILFAPGNRTLATLTADKAGGLWDAATGKLLRDLGGNGDPIPGAMAFTPKGESIILAFPDKTVRIWSIESGKELLRFKDVEAVCLTLSPDGKVLAAGDSRGAVALCELSSGQVLRRCAPPEKAGPTTALGFADNGKTLIVTSHDPSSGIFSLARVFETDTAREKHKNEACGEIKAISPTGNTLAGTNWGSGLCLNSPMGDADSRLWQRYPGGVVDVAFSPDGKKLAAVGEWQSVCVRDTKSGKRTRETSADWGEISDLTFTHDGKGVVTVTKGGSIANWEARTGKSLWSDEEDRAPVLCVTLSPDGTMLAIGQGQRIELRDAMTGKIRKTIENSEMEIQSLAFSPNGRSLLVGELYTLRVNDILRKWRGLVMLEIPEGTEQMRFSKFDGVIGGCVSSVAFAPNGKSVLSNSSQHSVSLDCPLTGRVIRRLAPDGEEYCPIYSPDGRTIVTKGAGKIKFRETATGRERFTLQTKGAIYGLAVSPDGRTLASAHRDGTICLWDVLSRKQYGRYSGHQGPVNRVAFSPDGKLLVSGSSDGTALVWDLFSRALPALPTHKLEDKELAALVLDLAGTDAEKAARALPILVAAPDQTVRALRDCLHPAHSPELRSIERLITALDDDDFSTREKAVTELKVLGQIAQPALFALLNGKPSAEAAKRALTLIETIDPAKVDAERIREDRCLEVLEVIGTPEARRFLNELSKGSPAAHLTQEAQASIERLTRRNAEK
jgi:WD40 repeat protein